jgi:hypothetical protein
MTDEPNQQPDGGIPAPWSAGLSSLDATCYRLDVGQLTGPQRELALDFLASRRSPDGTWREAEELAGRLPPWLDPEDPRTLPYLTWNCALTLARAGRLETVPPIEPIGYRQTIWLAAATLLWLGRSDEAAPLLNQLEATIDELDEDDRAWMRRALGRFGPFARRPSLTIAAATAS